jgi:integrase/recombinase XerD
MSGYPLDSFETFKRSEWISLINVTPHVLRHTMLTMLAELGWQPELLQERAGHASFQQTYQMYVHPSREALRAAWEHTQEQVGLFSSRESQR